MSGDTFVDSARSLVRYIRPTLNALGMGRAVRGNSRRDLVHIGAGVEFEVLRNGFFDKRYRRNSSDRDTSRIIGFATEGSVDSAIVRAGKLFQVVSTAGHEIGHSLTKRIRDSTSGEIEETKAQAFEMAWDLAIERGNIGGLGSGPITYFKSKSYDETESPVHFEAHQTVMEWARKENPLDIYYEIVGQNS